MSISFSECKISKEDFEKARQALIKADVSCQYLTLWPDGSVTPLERPEKPAGEFKCKSGVEVALYDKTHQ